MTAHGGLLQIEYPAVHDACCVAALIDPTVFTTEKADIRVELNGRWTKGMTVANFERMGGMHHFGGTASEQANYRPTVAMKLDHAKFCDLIVDALERLTRRKGVIRSAAASLGAKPAVDRGCRGAGERGDAVEGEGAAVPVGQ